MVKKLYRNLSLILITILVGVGFNFTYITQVSAASVNLAYGKTVSTSSIEASAYLGQNAVDGNGTTVWSSSYSDQQYITVDLGTVQTISSVVLQWRWDYASQFQIQTSTDNVNWNTVYSNYNGLGGKNIINFASTNARYVKMYAFKRATSYGYSLYEFEIYNKNTYNELDYIKQISGSKTIIGIQNREPNSNPALQTNTIYGITGKYPGLWGGDFLFSSDDVNNRWNMIYECKNQWDRGSVVNLMLHVVPPTQLEPGSWDGGVVSKLTDAQWTSLITNGGDLNKKWKLRLDEYAKYLSYLKDNNVTVLFRPFHEMNQGIFWWAGRPGTNGTAALYRLTHDYLVKDKGLTNLIWVWDMQDLDLNWSQYNPGDAYWDIFALDVYNSDGFTKAKYDTALSIAGNKPIAIGECSKLPTANELLNQPKWVTCMSWAELTFSDNTNAQIAALYSAGNVLTRDELPNFK